VSSSTRKFSAEEKGKTQVYLIKPISEGQKKVLMGLEKSFKIPEDCEATFVPLPPVLQGDYARKHKCYR